MEGWIDMKFEMIIHIEFPKIHSYFFLNFPGFFLKSDDSHRVPDFMPC